MTEDPGGGGFLGSTAARVSVVVLAIYAGCVIAWLMRPKPQHTTPEWAPTWASSSWSATAGHPAVEPPHDLPGPSAPVAAVSPPSPAPGGHLSAKRAPEDLVRAAMGQWRSEDGAVLVEVDPPRERIGSRPPFKLVVHRGRKEFGCEFTDGNDKTGMPPKHVDALDHHFYAWCGNEMKPKGKKTAVLGLDVDDGLHISLLVDGKFAFTAAGLAKQSPQKR